MENKEKNALSIFKSFCKWGKLTAFFALLTIIKDIQEWTDFLRGVLNFISKIFSKIHFQDIPNIAQHSWVKVCIDVIIIWLFYSLEKNIRQIIGDQQLITQALIMKVHHASAIGIGDPWDAYLYHLKSKFSDEEIERLKELGVVPDYYTDEKFHS